jgi:hypothetical protein
MTSFLSMPLNRRSALKLGTGIGLAGAAGVVGYQVVPPSPSAQLEPVDVLAREFVKSLDAEQRADTCVNYEHPLRQYHNRGVWGGGREVMFGFSRRQRRLLTDLTYAGLSIEGRTRVPDEYFMRMTGVHGMRVLVCGDPAAPPYQVIMTAGHLNLRIGGRSREGAAFGGPQVYGDQRGNETAGLPGNTYRDQFVLAQQLLHGLPREQQQRALLEAAPVQTAIELQGRHGVFPGLGVGDLAPEHRAMLKRIVDQILATYPPDDVAYAWSCLNANGGIDALAISYYERGQDGTIPDGQVFRIEGPGAVLYFRGYPHVHAFVNIAMDGDSPLSSGEPLADNPAWLDRDGVRRLFEVALRVETGAALGYYPEDSVAGRLRPGTIRSGDIYTLESWQEDVAVATVHGSVLEGPSLLHDVGHQPIERSATYRVASTKWGIDHLRERVGRVESETAHGLLRDLTVRYVKKHGFASPNA